MKAFKRIAAFMLAMIMVFGLTMTASAAEGDIKISVTTSASGASVTGHTYDVYQIFTGDVAEDGKTLSNVKFGANYKPTDKTVKAAMEWVSGMSATVAAVELKKVVTGNPVATLMDSNSHEAEVAPGYYLIVDVSTGLPQGETSSAFILQVLESVAIKSKHTSVPNVEKKIDDTNDSVDATDEMNWQDSADHDIKDSIPFKLKMTVPAMFSQFKEYGEAYKFVFHDTEEAGLTFKNDAKVYVDGVEIKSGFEVVYPAKDGHTFDVVFADLTKIDGVNVGSEITVEYHSELNENAVLGSQGNVNTVYGEYSNLHRPEYPGRTPDDSVIAFTYKVVVNKYDDKNNRLTGAEFQLEKFIASANGTETYNDVKGTWTKLGVPTKTEEGKVFTFTGLDDGEYRLTETKTPDGYNTIDPIYFTVEAEHVTTWNGEVRTTILQSLTGEEATGKIAFAPIDIEASEEVAENENVGLTTDVINQSGTILPETGGMGTTLFYIGGGIMVLAAVVLLVTKKRMMNAE